MIPSPRSPFARAAGAVLGHVQGSVLVVFGGALLLGVLSVPADHDEPPEPARDRRYDVREELNDLNVTMRDDPAVGLSSLVLRDSFGKKLFVSGYDKLHNWVYFVNKNSETLTQVQARDDGGVTLRVLGPRASTRIDFRRDGSGDLVVNRRDEAGTRIGEVAISPEGRASIVPAATPDGPR